MLEKIAKLADEDGRNSQRVYLAGPVKSDAGKSDEFRSVTEALLSFEHKPPSHPRVTRPSDAFSTCLARRPETGPIHRWTWCRLETR